MKRCKHVLFFIVAALASPQTFAQEGYPLDGTWRGEYGHPGADGTLAVVVMEWDGSVIHGRINPGRNTINFTSASLDPENWTVHFEATAPDGQPIVRSQIRALAPSSQALERARAGAEPDRVRHPR